MTKNITIKISDEDLRNILITAVEGNPYVRDWCIAKDGTYSAKKGTITVAEHNDSRDPEKRGPWHKVTLATLRRGLQLCADAKDDEGGWAFTSWLKDRCGDALSANNIFQFAVLGELKYG